jgi:LemA protein
VDLTYILIGIGVVIVFYVIFKYNKFIRLKNQVKESFAGMDVHLKKRYDLIPNLVATVKQYATHEESTLTKLTELRSKAMSGNVSSSEKLQLEAQIGTAMKGIMIAVENYPDLKANQNFMHLQRTLNEIEEQLSASRRYYNAAVKQLNDAVMMFPGNILAGIFNIKTEAMFEIDESERKNVNVGDLFKS